MRSEKKNGGTWDCVGDCSLCEISPRFCGSFRGLALISKTKLANCCKIEKHIIKRASIVVWLDGEGFGSTEGHWFLLERDTNESTRLVFRNRNKCLHQTQHSRHPSCLESKKRMEGLYHNYAKTKKHTTKHIMWNLKRSVNTKHSKRGCHMDLDFGDEAREGGGLGQRGAPGRIMDGPHASWQYWQYWASWQYFFLAVFIFAKKTLQSMEQK